MTLRILIATICFLVVAGCNNDTSTRDRTDSAAVENDTDQRGWPNPQDIMGGDSTPSPETHADTSQSISK